LYRRFLLSQETAQVDPWAERVAGLEKEQFEPIALRSVA
jgi:nitrite reductase (NADH) large subunit